MRHQAKSVTIFVLDEESLLMYSQAGILQLGLIAVGSKLVDIFYVREVR
jgi:hypothetical protein